MLIILSGDISRASRVFNAMGPKFVISTFNIGEVTPMDVDGDKSMSIISGPGFRVADRGG